MQFGDTGSLAHYEWRYWWKPGRFLKILGLIVIIDLLRSMLWRHILPSPTVGSFSLRLLFPSYRLIQPFPFVMLWLAYSTIERLRRGGIGEDLALTPITGREIMWQVVKPLLAFTAALALASSLLLLPAFFLNRGVFGFPVVHWIVTTTLERLVLSFALPLLFLSTALLFSGSTGTALLMSYVGYLCVDYIAIGVAQALISFSSPGAYSRGLSTARIIVWSAVAMRCVSSAARRFEQLLIRR